MNTSWRSRAWVVCPICRAGSPAGIRCCPRCRYTFRVAAVSEATEFTPGPSPTLRSETPNPQKRIQITLRSAMVVVATLGCILARPELVVPALGPCVFVLVILFLSRSLISLRQLLAFMVLAPIVIGLVVPRFVSAIRTVHPARRLLAPTIAAAPDEPAPHANYTERIPGSDVRFEMIAIPGGTFPMGSPDEEPGRGDDEGPEHPVTIRPFWMGKFEVTWDEYAAFRKGRVPSNKSNVEDLARDADAVTRPTPPYPDETRGYGREGYPAIGVSHHAAMEYCYWLSKQTGKTYRLPTEAEWEYACRAGTDTAYFWGDSPRSLDASRGSSTTATTNPTPSAARPRTPGASTTSSATPRSGASTSIKRTPTPRVRLTDRRSAPSFCQPPPPIRTSPAADPGMTGPKPAAAQPGAGRTRAGTWSILIKVSGGSGTPTSLASASCGRSRSRTT